MPGKPTKRARAIDAELMSGVLQHIEKTETNVVEKVRGISMLAIRNLLASSLSMAKDTRWMLLAT